MTRISAKEKLLKTAAELFSKRGYGNVGINEIIKTANTAKASFYQHFPSKEDLCVAWLKEIHNKSVDHHESLLQSEKEASDIIIDYFKSLRIHLQENSFRGCPYTNTGSFLGSDEKKIKDQIHIHKEFQQQFFLKLASKVLPSKEAEPLGKQLFLLYSGASTESQNLESLKPVDDAITLISITLQHTTLVS